MKSHFIIAALAAAISFGVHATNSVTTTSVILGDKDNGPNASFSYSDKNLGSSFSDTLTFTLTGSTNWKAKGEVEGDFIGIKLGSLVLGQGLKTLNVSIFGHTYTDTLANPTILYDEVEVKIPYTVVHPGTYTATIWGTTADTKLIPGKPSYQFSLVAQPVPEPETYAMMLVGLGLVGAMVRRRNRPAA